MVIALVLLGTFAGYVTAAIVAWSTGSLGFGAIAGVGCGMLVIVVAAIGLALTHGARRRRSDAPEPAFTDPLTH